MSNNCFFCKRQVPPSFKEPDVLRKYLTHRGKIVSRERSQVCALHQRKLMTEIKKARTLALLPFVVYES